jgi:hypothetical protein
VTTTASEGAGAVVSRPVEINTASIPGKNTATNRRRNDQKVLARIGRPEGRVGNRLTL